MEKEIFNFFTTLVEKISGISYGPGKEYLVKARLNELALTLGYKDVKELYSVVKNDLNPQITTQIVDALTTNETYFFRDYHPFEALRKQVFPEIFKLREKEKKVSIWSAGCSSGQEPYSIAMLLLEYFSDYLKLYRVSILATDISINAIKKAKEGVYNQIEVNRGLPVKFLVKYFKQEGGNWRIDDKVKKMVRFEVLNLLEVSRKIRQTFDIIFCRYVLIYFSEEVKKKVFTDLWKLLKPEGYLFLGATEIPVITFPDMERKTIGKTICYRKKVIKKTS